MPSLGTIQVGHIFAAEEDTNFGLKMNCTLLNTCTFLLYGGPDLYRFFPFQYNYQHTHLIHEYHADFMLIACLDTLHTTL